MAIRGSRIYHVNSNCLDLDPAVVFYEALGLHRVVRTVPSKNQSGAAFGLDEVSWDAWVLQSEDGFEGVSLDLLEWTTPLPTGTPPALDGEPGFNRLVFVVSDLDATITVATKAGGTVVGGPLEIESGGGPVRVAMLLDPDGVPVQLVQGNSNRIAHVVVNCVDIDESLAYYRDVMGLSPMGEVDLITWPGALFGHEAEITVKGVGLSDAGSVFTVALVQWLNPAPATAVRVRRANELGLFRMAWSTDDCVADEAVVISAGSVPFVPTEKLSVGDDLPLLLVLFWPGPNGECLELIEVTDRSGAL